MSRLRDRARERLLGAARPPFRRIEAGLRVRTHYYAARRRAPNVATHAADDARAGDCSFKKASNDRGRDAWSMQPGGRNTPSFPRLRPPQSDRERIVHPCRAHPFKPLRSGDADEPRSLRCWSRMASRRANDAGGPARERGRHEIVAYLLKPCHRQAASAAISMK